MGQTPDRGFKVMLWHYLEPLYPCWVHTDTKPIPSWVYEPHGTYTQSCLKPTTRLEYKGGVLGGAPPKMPMQMKRGVVKPTLKRR